MDKNKLAVVHIVKKELGLTEEEYRQILREVAGVESAKDLDGEKFTKLMRYFVRSRHYRVNDYGLTLRQKLYLKYLAGCLGWDLAHLNHFIQKYYHKPALERLTKKQAIKAIESLKHIRDRLPRTA